MNKVTKRIVEAIVKGMTPNQFEDLFNYYFKINPEATEPKKKTDAIEVKEDKSFEDVSKRYVIQSIDEALSKQGTQEYKALLRSIRTEIVLNYPKVNSMSIFKIKCPSCGRVYESALGNILARSNKNTMCKPCVVKERNRQRYEPTGLNLPPATLARIQTIKEAMADPEKDEQVKSLLERTIRRLENGEHIISSTRISYKCPNCGTSQDKTLMGLVRDRKDLYCRQKCRDAAKGQYKKLY